MTLFLDEMIYARGAVAQTMLPSRALRPLLQIDMLGKTTGEDPLHPRCALQR
jgi:hypothetical protein